MEVEYQTMPPVPGIDPEAETTEAKRRRLAFMPPVSGTMPQASSRSVTAQLLPPVVPAPAGRSKASASPSVMPPVQPSAPQPAKPTPPTPTAMPPVSGKTEMSAPSSSQPAANIMPPVDPAQQDFEKLTKQGIPHPKWWQRALEIAGSVAPFGLAIEKQLPQTPIGYNAALNKAGLAAAKEQTIGKGAREERAAAENTREGRIRFLQEHPDLEMTPFERADFESTGKMPQKEPAKPSAKIAYHYTNDEGKEVSVFEDGTEKVGGAAQGKPDKLDKKIDEFVDPQNNRINVMQRADGSTYNVKRGQSRSEAGVGSPSDVKDIANGIIAGIDPPDLTKYGYRDRTAIAAEMKRQGFDLSRADQDWHATQKHLATLNGAQQERLRQAVSFTDDSLHILDGLYNQWQKVGPTSGWKVFNKASLATSKQLPGEAGNLAHRLEAQISDLTSELGTVYKGGNSSTDESLKLAAKNLEADWNEKTFKDSINQIRQNLEIRKNSIRHSQPAGVSANSPYTPKSETETPKDFGAAPEGKKEGDTGKLPDGTKVVIKGGRIVAQ